MWYPVIRVHIRRKLPLVLLHNRNIYLRPDVGPGVLRAVLGDWDSVAYHAFVVIQYLIHYLPERVNYHRAAIPTISVDAVDQAGGTVCSKL